MHTKIYYFTWMWWGGKKINVSGQDHSGLQHQHHHDTFWADATWYLHFDALPRGKALSVHGHAPLSLSPLCSPHHTSFVSEDFSFFSSKKKKILKGYKVENILDKIVDRGSVKASS